jgi:rubrerythrin
MDFISLDDIIAFAIDQEREAAAFYRDLGGRESFADKRQLFHDFAAEEDKHAAILAALTAGSGQVDFAGYDWKWIVDIKRSNYVAEIAYHPDMDYREILLLAAKREEKALAFYNECQAGVERPEAKTVFKMLCQEEAKHKLALESMLDDFMAEMGD